MGQIGSFDCFFLVGWDFWYCGHYWPIVPALDDRVMVIVDELVE
jgi:hypothetical protein